MRLGAANHGSSAAAKSLVVAVMAAATLAQFFALSHEVTVQHFRCAEHGELTHVAPLAIDLPPPTLGARPARRPPPLPAVAPPPPPPAGGGGGGGGGGGPPPPRGGPPRPGALR